MLTATSRDGNGIYFGNCGVRSEVSSSDATSNRCFSVVTGRLVALQLASRMAHGSNVERMGWMSQKFEKEKLNLHDGVRSEANRA